MIQEIWKDIPGWQGLYQVSNMGRIKNVRRNKVKVLDRNNCGYLRVQLCDDKRRSRYFVHRLVAHAFVEGYFEGAVVNHKDMDRENNCWWNLEWTTPAANQRYTVEVMGVHDGMFQEKPYLITLSNGATLYFDNMTLVARSLGLSKTTLYNRLRKDGYIPEVEGYLSECNAERPFPQGSRAKARNGIQR